jgi:hypothetical protein
MRPKPGSLSMTLFFINYRKARLDLKTMVMDQEGLRSMSILPKNNSNLVAVGRNLTSHRVTRRVQVGTFINQERSPISIH